MLLCAPLGNQHPTCCFLVGRKIVKNLHRGPITGRAFLFLPPRKAISKQRRGGTVEGTRPTLVAALRRYSYRHQTPEDVARGVAVEIHPSARNRCMRLLRGQAHCGDESEFAAGQYEVYLPHGSTAHGPISCAARLAVHHEQGEGLAILVKEKKWTAFLKKRDTIRGFARRENPTSTGDKRDK